MNFKINKINSYHLLISGMFRNVTKSSIRQNKILKTFEISELSYIFARDLRTSIMSNLLIY
ncbi:hypothetical protein D1164_18735 [Mariniphaga sediminis]|uniref:Uncharacterized protein n=1 Tax=Mariniphaga sediminis TaxID=1628158 RepID=A0A399CYZ5_9BACT|nr:hypothetical protein D1164_18735 [Mariniphaga sediminis]